MNSARIQHNIASMNAYRNYTTNNSLLSKNLEKLSSGYKINRAGDDAAGLAISEKMRIQITGLNTATQNAKDGISLVQTAEGALQEVHDMLKRMYQLAEQSANGTYDDDVDRAQLQKEVNKLRDEINRIADSTNFNGKNLLDGSLAGASAKVLTTNGADPVDVAEVSKIDSSTISSLSGAITLAGETGAATTGTLAARLESWKDTFNTAPANAGASGWTADISGVTVNEGGAQEAKLAAANVFTPNATTGKAAVNTGSNLTIAGFDYTVQATDDTLQKQFDNWVAAYNGDASNNFTVDATGITVEDAKAATFVATGTLDASAAAAIAGGTAGSATVGGATVNIAGGTTNDADSIKNAITPATVSGYTAAVEVTGDSTGGYSIRITYTKDKAGAVGDNAPTDFSAYNNAATTTWTNGSDVTVSGDLVFTGKTAAAAAAGTNIGDTVSGAGNPTGATYTNLGGAPSLSGDIKFTANTAGALATTGATAISNATTVTAGEDGTATAAVSTFDFTGKSGGDFIGAKMTVSAGGQDQTLEFYKTGETYSGSDTGVAIAENADGAAIADAVNSALNVSSYGTNTVNGAVITVTSTATGATAEAATATFEGGKGLNLQIGDTADNFNRMSVNIKDIHTVSLTGTNSNSKTLADIDIGTEAGAAEAMAVIKDATNYISDIRGDLGATQNRLEHTINNLGVMKENIQDAESALRDTDVAEEMMQFTKNSIMNQAAQAMLAQANQLPQGVLQLLQ